MPSSGSQASPSSAIFCELPELADMRCRTDISRMVVDPQEDWLPKLGRRERIALMGSGDDGWTMFGRMPLIAKSSTMGLMLWELGRRWRVRLAGGGMDDSWSLMMLLPVADLESARPSASAAGPGRDVALAGSPMRGEAVGVPALLALRSVRTVARALRSKAPAGGCGGPGCASEVGRPSGGGGVALPPGARRPSCACTWSTASSSVDS